jgi:plastocyanin
MKLLFAIFTIVSLLMVPYGCNNNSPTYYNGGNPTPTPDPTVAETVGVIAVMGGAYIYNMTNIDIPQGRSVKWDNTNSGHPLNIDMGSGTCVVSGETSFPFTFTFNAKGTYHFHCGIHSTCGNGSCPDPFLCVGMVGTITVQ